MPSVISLKDLKQSSTLKDQIRKLEEDKEELQKQLDLQKKLEIKLREDILSHKKDFEHLEKQFDHFAGLEADYEALQTEIQMERLENVVSQEKEENKLKAQVKKARDELRQAQDELKELKQLDPQRLKRQVVDLKKKSASQAAENKTVNTALVTARKELKETTLEKERLEAELKAARQGSDQFWQSKDGAWNLYESVQLLAADDPADPTRRVRCVNLESGVCALSRALGDKDQALWYGEAEIPEEVSLEAGKRLKKFAAEAEEGDED